MSRCIFAPSAKLDFKEIASYITRFNPAAARRFREKIKQQCKLLADFPNMGQSCDNFEISLRSFPVENYWIFYRPIDSGVDIHTKLMSKASELVAEFSEIKNK